MSQVSHLPKEIQDFLIQHGFNKSSDVTWARANPNLEDQVDDDQVSFIVREGDLSRYVLVDPQGQLHLYETSPESPPPLSPSVTAGDASRWTRRINSASPNPKIAQWAAATEAGFANPKALPKAIAVAENKASMKTEQTARKLPNDFAHPFEKSILVELSHLPAGHPAKDVTELLIEEHATAVAQAEATGSDVKAVDKQYGNFVAGMKSAKAYYKAGQTMVQEYPHLLQKKATILYPAAGHNVASLCIGMALIEHGAPGAEFIFTDLAGVTADQALELLKKWAKTNPNLKIPVPAQWQKIDAYTQPYTYKNPGGESSEITPERRQLTFQYLGRPITITYALNDNPFNPQEEAHSHVKDQSQSDVVVIHDPYGGRERKHRTDAHFLAQVLPHASPYAPKVVLMPNEGDPAQSMRERYAHYDLYPLDIPYRETILPFGSKIEGSFGHATYYNEVSELGETFNQSALLFSTSDPALRGFAGDKEASLELIDFLQLAGGELKQGLDLEISGNKVLHRPDYKDENNNGQMDRGEGKNAALKSLRWLSARFHQLSPYQKEIFALLSARLIMCNLEWAYSHGREEWRQVPENLKAGIGRVFREKGLGDPFAKDGAIFRTDLRKLDAVIEKVARERHEGWILSRRRERERLSRE